MLHHRVQFNLIQQIEDLTIVISLNVATKFIGEVFFLREVVLFDLLLHTSRGHPHVQHHGLETQ